MGDPAGIGPEVVVQAVNNPKIQRICHPLLIGSANVFAKAAILYPYPLSEIEIFNITKETEKISAESIKTAVKLALQGEIKAIVTAPISKSALNKAGYKYPGHTEFLAALTNTQEFAMMFVSPKLKVTLLTTHLPLKNISQRITKKNILTKIKLTDIALKKYFGIENPHLAICPFNPHAGENGLLGSEEREKIVPAVKEAQRQGFRVVGPLPADSLFYQALKGKYDAVIAMYHDQGLIPVKLLDFQKAVNITLGLPFIRTSPAHGTAIDIAGKGIANPQGMMSAIKLAVKICTRNETINGENLRVRN